MLKFALISGVALTVTLGSWVPASAKPVTVTVTNASPENGLFATPVWVGFHEGGFDLYDRGEAPSVALEELAEDGSTARLTSEFDRLRPRGVQATLDDIGPIGPGQSVSRRFDLDPSANRYLSYASMVIPSNDAFVANGDPRAHAVFDERGNVTPISFRVLGAEILDAGTEVNTETDAAFLDQTAPNTGLTEGGTVELHPGFVGSFANMGEGGNILGGTNALGGFIDPIAADFTREDFAFLEVVVTPVPPAAALFVPAVAGLCAVARSRRRAPAGAR
jgi:hypothetical protein